MSLKLKPMSIVMIAYNEANHIEKVVFEFYNEIFKKLPKGSEYIIYLDKPKDNTSFIVKNLAKKLDLKIIEGKENLGYGGAFKKALSHAKNEVIFFSDSSGKYAASDFWNLIKYESDYDIVTGFRKNRKDPILRRLITFIQRIITSALFLLPFNDYNAGYKIFHKNTLKNLLPECKYMIQSIPSELVIRAIKKGYTVKCADISFKDRTGKNTGTNYKRLPKLISNSLGGYFKIWYELKFNKINFNPIRK